jgi:large subunit ribosomal protein L25
METIEINIEPRETRGKGAARRLRREGRLPATLYGCKRSALPVVLNAKEFDTRVAVLEGSHLIRLLSANADINGRMALVKEVQRDPVSRSLLHTDLYEVDMEAKLRIPIPLHFIGRAEGVELGGILQPVRREVEVICLPAGIPEFIEVDVSALGFHDAIHVSELKVPDGVEISYDSDFTVVTVLPPIVEEVKVATEAEAAAPAEGAAAPAAAAEETKKEGG